MSSSGSEHKSGGSVLHGSTKASGRAKSVLPFSAFSGGAAQFKQQFQTEEASLEEGLAFTA